MPPRRPADLNGSGSGAPPGDRCLPLKSCVARLRAKPRRCTSEAGFRTQCDLDPIRGSCMVCQRFFMTDSRFRIARLLTTRLLTILCFVAVPAVSSAAQDQPSTANTFNTPGYPIGAARQMGGPTPNSGNRDAVNGQGIPNIQNDVSGERPMQNAPGYGGATRQGGQGANAGEMYPRFPDPPPGEFQKFVEGATGRLLPLFGSRFFADARNPFTSVDNVPVSSDYTVGPGDEIVLRAWGAIDVDYRSTVDRNGLLNLPKIGSFNVAGVKASELEKHLRSQIGRLYTNFDLSVSLGQLRGVRVFVVGPAQRPGVFTLPSQSTLLSAVVTAGGPAPGGSMRKVLLRRDGRVISELDIYEFLVQGDKSRDVQLAAGDVIVFQPAGPRVALSGALDNPAIYELKMPQEPLREVLRYAGGTPTLANPNRAQLERVDTSQPKAARFVEEFRLDGDGLQKTLRDGDVLTLLAISPEFANAVTLRGHVAQPLRVPFTPGMRIRDLIPDRDALITPDFYRRKNMLVQMIDDEDGRRADPNRSAPYASGRGPLPAENAYRRRDGFGYPPGAPQGNSAYGGSMVEAPLGARAELVRSPGEFNADGTEAYRNDRQPALLTRAERQRQRDDREVVQASRRAPTALFDDLNWDYAVIERLDRQELTTRVIPFNLGKAIIQGDDANNLELISGDVVTVYSQKDIRVSVSRQTRLVSLEGEVASPGVYQLTPGDTLQTLIQRAGGFTPQAYVYGLEFSREETRQRQRENLVAAITRLEALASVQAARDVASRRDDPLAAASASTVSNAATQAQLNRLRSVQPNGRIALELSPEVTSLAALPDVVLDGGDRIIVPPRPGFVTVAGAVVNSNAFLWKPGRTAGDYLRVAGADEAAEPENMFILRADGTVSHAGDRRGFLGFGRGGLESEVLQPGDALVVPNQLDFETWGRAFVRNLKDFSQIFSGFGVGIAAVRTLR